MQRPSRATTDVWRPFCVSFSDPVDLQRVTAIESRARQLLTGRVLITGASGFIGANLVRTLVDHASEVHITLQPASQTWRLNDVLPRLHVHLASLSDGEQLARAFAAARPHVVLHLATPRGQHEASRVRILEANLMGACHLLRLVREFRVERLVATNSSLEYAPTDGAISETSPLGPCTVHGVAKAASSLLFRQSAIEHGTPLCVLRLFHVYGPWESAHRLLPTAIRAALDGTPLRLTDYGIRRDWVYVDDVVDAIWRAAGLDLTGEIINVGTGLEHANEDVAACVASVIGRSIQTAVGAFPRRIADMPHRRADWSKAEQLIGWTPRHELAAGIGRTVEWFQKHPLAWSARNDVAPLVC
jgi:nucleoside-diphosphate-sugar epimerase